MEITRQTYNLINYHRAEIISTLDYDGVVRAIERITAVLQPRFGRVRYKGGYRLDALFTGVVTVERIEIYWWKALYPKKYVRVRGTLSGTVRSVLSLRSGGPLLCFFEILAVVMAAAVLVLGLMSPDAGKDMMRFLVVFIGGYTWFFIASYRRRTAFDAAVAAIAEAIVSREPEPYDAPDRTVSSRKA
jgi:hypothetical protein